MKEKENYEGEYSVLVEHRLTEAQQRIKILSYRQHLTEMLNDASIDRIMALDTSLNIIAWNRKSEEVTGVSKRTAIGSQYYTLFPEVSKNKAVTNAIEQALKGRTFFLPSDKSDFEGGCYESHFIPLKDDNDAVIGIMNIKHDIAHRIKAENELKALNKAMARKSKELQQRNEELLSFAHVTSHDLKEPLRKIYTFAGMINNYESEQFSERGKSYFKRIQAAVQRMGMLTDDILTFAELNTERSKKTDVNLEHMLLFVTRTLQEQIETTQAIIQHSPLPTVRGYRQLISQLLYHLITNALKFRRPDVRLEVYIDCEQVSGETIKNAEAIVDATYLKLSVQDNGIGFDKAYKDKIFQMFQKLNADEYLGTGIGLTLCKKIAAIHYGFMTAEGKEGKGSNFCVYFPV
ncbi:MAG TPA: ATP-binding protein [Flavipsychrobacter sp.]|nr:ATP-binding protein [Flavipsychrobacter sp.]